MLCWMRLLQTMCSSLMTMFGLQLAALMRTCVLPGPIPPLWASQVLTFDAYVPAVRVHFTAVDFARISNSSKGCSKVLQELSKSYHVCNTGVSIIFSTIARLLSSAVLAPPVSLHCTCVKAVRELNYRHRNPQIAP